MTLIFNGRLQVVEVRIHAKFHQAKCSGSRVIGVDAEKKLSDNVENDTAVILSLIHISEPTRPY